MSSFLKKKYKKCFFCFEVVDDGRDHQFIKGKENKRIFLVFFQI